MILLVLGCRSYRLWFCLQFSVAVTVYSPLYLSFTVEAATYDTEKDGTFFKMKRGSKHVIQAELRKYVGYRAHD